MVTKTLTLGFVVALVLVGVANCKQVEDFTYSELEVAKQEHPASRVTLTAQRSILSRWEFPKTWQIQQFLTQNLQTQSELPQISNIAGQISFLKDKVAQFLRLSNKAQLLVKNIQCNPFLNLELPQMKNDLLLDVKDEQLAVLESQETKLLALNNQINLKAGQLEKIVQQMMLEQENPLFKEAALNFEKKALLQKITLFEGLLAQANSDQQQNQAKGNDNKLANYFKQLDHIFEKESGLIDEIDTLLKNHNQLTILKARVTSLTSQLKAHELTLSEKEECSREFEKIKEKQAHDREVIKLIETLKQKKLQYNEPNKYCEGVVNKLIERVKKLLKGYDYVYECAQELQEVRGNRELIQNELNEAQRKLDELQLSKGIQQFRSTFQNNRAVIAGKVNELKSLQLGNLFDNNLDDFYNDPSLIQRVIDDSQNQIKQIQSELANLPAKSSRDLVQVQKNIREKVNEIKSLKAQYCKENEAYVENSQIIENRLGKLEQQQEYNNWVRRVETQKFEELEEIKRQMKDIEAEVLEYLQ